jgi:glycosyltransferase involved in cell wall biosynthesis
MTERNKMMGMPVIHVITDLGLPTELFVGDAISAVERESWIPYVTALRVHQSVDFVSHGHVYCVPAPSASQRLIARVLYRRPYVNQARLASFVTAAAPWAKAWEIGLVHAHFGWAAPYGVMLANRLDVPLVVTFYGSDASAPGTPARWRRQRYPPRLDVGPYAQVFARANRLIAVSDFVKSRLRQLGYEGPIDLVRPAVPIDRLPFSAGRPALDPLRILFVGRLVPVKGADVLLRAMVRVLDHHRNVRLEIIGDGPQRSALERLAHELALGKSVLFRGVCDRQEVIDSLATAHIVVVPSRVMPNGQEEASSMIFKEAMAMGVPVVATASGGLPETCPPAYRHELVPPGDPTALARSICDSLTWVITASPDAWHKRATDSRQWVTHRYHPSILGTALADSYRAALAQSH